MDSAVKLVDILERAGGITAVIGGGGKSTLLARGGRALAARERRTIIATSTHMLPVAGIPQAGALAEAPDAPLVQLGRLEEGSGKLVAPADPWDRIARAADHVLVEADGSRGLPFKAHNDREPQIPADCARVIYVVGALGFGLPVYDTVHRPQLFRDLTGAPTSAPATPELVASGIVAEGLVGMPGDLIVVNQVESARTLDDAERLARALAPVLDVPVYAGSLRAGELVRLA